MQNARPVYAAGDTVALFVPCYVDLLFPEVGRAMVAVLERIGARIDYPLEQTCCGQPAFNAGHWEHARTLARRFAAVFGEYQWIVVPSGSCGAMARNFFSQLDLDERTVDVGRRVYDFATFLVDVAGVTDIGARFPHSVTYLDGCHGRRELQCTAAAERLLRAVQGIDYRPLPAIEQCCGFGGLFSVKYDALSVSMGNAKCENALATGAEFLVSGDASCLMHVGGVLQKQSAPLRTMHLAQVLAAQTP